MRWPRSSRRGRDCSRQASQSWSKVSWRGSSAAHTARMAGALRLKCASSSSRPPSSRAALSPRPDCHRLRCSARDGAGTSRPPARAAPGRPDASAQRGPGRCACSPGTGPAPRLSSRLPRRPNPAAARSRPARPRVPTGAGRSRLRAGPAGSRRAGISKGPGPRSAQAQPGHRAARGGVWAAQVRRLAAPRSSGLLPRFQTCFQLEGQLTLRGQVL